MTTTTTSPSVVTLSGEKNVNNHNPGLLPQTDLGVAILNRLTYGHIDAERDYHRHYCIYTGNMIGVDEPDEKKERFQWANRQDIGLDVQANRDIYERLLGYTECYVCNDDPHEHSMHIEYALNGDVNVWYACRVTEEWIPWNVFKAPQPAEMYLQSLCRNSIRRHLVNVTPSNQPISMLVNQLPLPSLLTCYLNYADVEIKI